MEVLTPPAAAPSMEDPLLDCLVVLARLEQRPFSAEALRAGLPLKDGRLTPELFVRAAERAGFAARVLKRPLTRILPAVLPAVLLMGDGSACVLTGLGGDGAASVIYPESGGVSQVRTSDLEAAYSGYAIFARPIHRPVAQEDRSRPRAWFWGTLWLARREYLDVLVASVLINVFALASPLFTMNVYDRVVPNNALETLWVLAGGVLIVFLFDFLLRTLRGYFLDVAGKKADVLLSGHLFEKVLGLRLTERPGSAGALAANLREFEAVRDFFTSATLAAVVDLPFALLFIACVWVIGGSLAWVALSAVPAVILVGLLLQIPLDRVVRQNFGESAQKHALLVETLGGLETVKSVSAEGLMQGRWERLSGLAAQSSLRSRLISSVAVNFSALAQQVVAVAVVVMGVYAIADGKLSVGALVACTILSARALAPLSQIAGLLTRWQHSRAALKSLDRIMALDVERPAEKTFLHRPVLKGDIEFAGVGFRYPQQPLAALDGVSIRINAGERVAILGRVGSGKSTLGRLILGLYQPLEGTVLLDGTDIAQIDPVDLRRNVGYVPQDVRLFAGSVRDNIRMGAAYGDDAAVLAAAEMAGAAGFLRRHPAGFDMPVGELGEGLSGGQRQAIALARALVSSPGILVLDEPTSAMDHGTEQQVIQALAHYLPGRTLVLTTHKPSMLALVDRLIVLEAGRVVADGPKAKVLAALGQGGQA